jgi:hypothetical protein
MISALLDTSKQPTSYITQPDLASNHIDLLYTPYTTSIEPKVPHYIDHNGTEPTNLNTPQCRPKLPNPTPTTHSLNPSTNPAPNLCLNNRRCKPR